MVEWHHQLRFAHTLEDSEGQGAWGAEASAVTESDTTEGPNSIDYLI